MARQIKEFRKDFNEEIYWIDNAFVGMPTFQLGAKYPADFLTQSIHFFQLIPRPAEILFYTYCLVTFFYNHQNPMENSFIWSFCIWSFNLLTNNSSGWT